MIKQSNAKSGEHRLRAFPTRRSAERALHNLLNEGFTRDDLTLFLHSPTSEEEAKSGYSATDQAIDAGGAIGAELGAAAGSIGGVLTGLGLLAIPGVGPMLAVGPIAAAFTGAITGVAIGGVAGSLVGAGLSEAEAAACERHMKAGRAVVIVNCGARCSRAVAIMNGAGAFDPGYGSCDE
jgi:hypothetical protein